MSDQILKEHTEKAKSVLLNRKIVQVRYLTDDEQDAFGWTDKSIVLQLDDGTILFPSGDYEGNRAGTLHYISARDSSVIPFI